MSSSRYVALGTISFTICFAAWGLIGAFAPRFREHFSLTAAADGPAGCGPCAARIAGAHSHGHADRPLRRAGCLRHPDGGGRGAGLDGAAADQLPRSAGGGVPAWTGGLVVRGRRRLRLPLDAAERQGSALGVYGLGNIGQSAAVFLGPVLAQRIGMPGVFHGAGSAAGGLGRCICGLRAQRSGAAARAARPGPRRDARRARPRTPGVAARGLLLPHLRRLRRLLHLPAHAAARTTSASRRRTPASAPPASWCWRRCCGPLGGWLSDRIGGARVLVGGVRRRRAVRAAAGLAVDGAVHRRRARLRGAARPRQWRRLQARAAVLPRHRPARSPASSARWAASAASSRRCCSAFFRDRTGRRLAGLRAAGRRPRCALWCGQPPRLPAAAASARTWRCPPGLRRTADRLRAGAWATLWTALLVAAIVVGSRNLQNFDAALVIYTFAVIFATWGVVYHYAVWLQKPPTRRLLATRLGTVAAARRLAQPAARGRAGRDPHRRRRPSSRSARACAGGCTSASSGAACSAVAITFPLVFGWIHFGTAPDDQMTYVTYLFGFPVGSFRLRTVAVLAALPRPRLRGGAGAGRHRALAVAAHARRGRAARCSSSRMDFLPLILLFAISVTGLALTVSTIGCAARSTSFLAILHAITVIAALLYLPFGKFFHIFQRPAQLGVKLYQEAGDDGRGRAVRALRRALRLAHAHRRSEARCCRNSASTTRMPGPAGHWQELCPAANGNRSRSRNCGSRRKLVAKPPLPVEELHRPLTVRIRTTRRPAAGQTSRGITPDRLVKTHCCFCGQQCGIQLKVRDNQVVGFEPWEEFPFNRGMLCPKGVKRYLQGSHPDRLLDPLMRTPSGLPDGDVGRGARFHRAPPARDPGEARPGRRRGLRRRVADHREVLPARQVRARGARHAAHRLQRPALHGVGGHGLQAGASASTARRTRGPTSRRPRSCSSIGANIGECAPITTDYLWRVPRQRRQADRRRPAHDADHAQRRPLPAGAARHGPGAAAWACCT